MAEENKSKERPDAVFMTAKDILWIMLLAILYELGAQYHGKLTSDYSIGVLFLYFLYKLNQIISKLNN